MRPFILILFSFFALSCSIGPSDDAFWAMVSDSDVSVLSNQWITFKPTSSQRNVGYIFYPGAKVEPVSYAPLLRSLAQNKYLSVIVPMPFNFAIFNANAALEVMCHYSEIDTWVISGHSLGGAMACSFVKANSGKAKGLVLLAGYPGEGDNLSGVGVKVLSIYATYDGLATPTKISNSFSLLPPGTLYYEVVGGNHAQFGYYGMQDGDGVATTSREEQIRQTQEKILEFLSNL